ELLMQIARVGIHIENAYTRLISEKSMAILLLDVPDVLETREKLKANGIEMLKDEIVYGR
ncbi:MAG: hypothetical protein ACOC1J_02515, partial [Prolixibacteraceae bacterium]